MQIFTRYKKWIIGGAIFLGCFVLYGIFFSGATGTGTGLVTSTQNTGGGSVNGGGIISTQIISALNQIESLNLDRSLFDDPVYRSLRDRSREIREESVGKANPFDPINTNNTTFNANTENQNTDAQVGPNGQQIPGNETGPTGPQTITNTGANRLAI